MPQAQAIEHINSYTPPQLAARWGVQDDKVRALIASGELKAFNIALDKNGSRPRWRILPEEVERFEQARSNHQPEKKPRRRRRAVATAGTNYF